MKIAQLALVPFLALAIALSATGPAVAAEVDVAVSIGISQPGVYGRVDIGRFPSPQVVVAQPIYVERPQRWVTQPEPVYMWVPPGHRKNWKKHCREYGACGAPVYFVRDDWYEQKVRHGGRGHDAHDDDRGRGNGQGHGKGKDKDKGKN